MEIRRFFVQPQDVSDGSVVIEGEEFAHLTRVLRYKTGYRLIACPGDGRELCCTLTEIGADRAVAKIDEVRDGQAELPYRVTLFQALPKGDKMSFIVQKSVELGVSEIVPFTSRNTEETKFNRARMQRVAVEACKQCGRCARCEIGELVGFDDVLASLGGFDVAVMPFEHAEKGKMGDVVGLCAAKNVALIIGSEGGFDSSEVEAAVAHGAQTITLGKRILRCETAGVVALALLDYERGELGR